MLPAPTVINASRIVPRLHQGAIPPYGTVLCEANFDLLVLCAQEHQPRAGYFPGVKVVHAPMADDDRYPNDDELQRASAAVNSVLETLSAGGRALVTCVEGRNRSGLVSVGVLHMRTGECGAACVEIVQAARPNALTNPYFVHMLSQLPRRLSAGSLGR